MIKLTKLQLQQILNKFEEKIRSLERDSYRCFTENLKIDPLLGAGKSFFPITLYCMSTLDFFSSAYFGYSEKKNDKSRIDQTTRMVEFLCKYFHYDPLTSRIAIDVFRHKLVHLGEPYVKKNIEGWEIAKDCAMGDHWKIKSYNLKGSKKISFGVNDFIRDLRNGVLNKDGYYEELTLIDSLQHNYLSFLKDILI